MTCPGHDIVQGNRFPHRKRELDQYIVKLLLFHLLRSLTTEVSQSRDVVPYPLGDGK